MAPSAHGLGQQELSISVTLDSINGRGVPPSPYETGPSSLMVEPIPSLTEAWEDARKRFSDRTKRSIDGPSIDMDRCLEDWAALYEVDDSVKARRKKKILGVIQNIVDGINVVGGIIAQGVSPTFGFAGPCFNALSFLLNIPRNIKAIYDTLLELFEEVENFLVRFKILRRIDSMKQLPSEMVVSASKMLIGFVDICGLAYAKLLDKHSFQIALKAAFLRSDSGIGAALADFRRMAQRLDSLTNTIALQNIFDVRETTRDTNLIVRESGTDIKNVSRLLEQTNNDARTRRAIQSRLAKIKEKLYTNEERNYTTGERAAEMQPEFSEELLAGTHAILEDCPEFCNWRDARPRSGRVAFLLRGPSGSGKSRIMEVFKKAQDKGRQNADKDEPSIYVAYHMFGGRVNKEATSLIPFALRNMAVQVAEQSTAYSKELENIVTMDRTSAVHQDNIEELWKLLKLSTFKAKAEATMYLLFDGIEHETANSVDKLLSLFTGHKAERAREVDSVSIRALLTIDSERPVDSSIPTLDMSDATKGLVRPYTIKELRRMGIFQSIDKKSRTRRERIIDAVSSPSRADQDEPAPWNFKDVKQKLERIKVAIQNDASSDELDRILQDGNKQSLDPKAVQAVGDLAASLSGQEISQINQMLPWLLYSAYAGFLEIEELEAVLFMTHNTDTLQSLITKVGGRFRPLFCQSNGFIYLRAEIEKVFRGNEEQSQRQVSARKPLISLQISIQNAEESTIQQFIWQLNEQIGTGKFDFESHTRAAHSMISVNKLDAHISILKTCLKLLNEGWRDEVEVLVRYARDYIPSHFIYLAAYMGDISIGDQKAISQSFVNFLSDPYHLAHDPDRHFGHGENWLANSEAAAAMRTWLETTKDHLQAREKRWLQTALKPSEGCLGYLKKVARTVGKKWVGRLKENADERRYCGWRVRDSNSLEVELFNWLSKYVESNIVEEDSRDPDGDLVVKAESESPKEGQNSDTAQESATQGEHDDQSPKQPNTDDESSPLMREKTIIETSPRTKIKVVIDWLVENDVACRENGSFHINIGYTYLAFGEYSEAERHFEHAVQDDTSKRQGLTALGRLHFARGQKQDAVVKLNAALSMLEHQKAHDDFTNDQNKILAELYRELAAMYEETHPKKLSEAVDLYEKSLECDDDLDVRWKTLALLCEANQPLEVSKATTLLEKWSDRMNKTGDSGLAYDLSRSADQSPECIQLERFIHAIQDPSLRSHVVRALSQAVETDEVSRQSEVKAKLLYLRGLAIVREVKEVKEGHRRMAVESWREALATTISEDYNDWYYPIFLLKAARGVAQHEFELSMSRLDPAANHQLSREERELAVEDLKHSLLQKAFSHPQMDADGAQLATNRFIVSLNMMLGRIDDAHVLLAEDMSTVMDLLTDDDDDNDIQGIRMLMGILCAMGDRVGTLSAFSLLDRKARKASVFPENSVADGETAPDVKESDYPAGCDCCRKDIDSNDPKGFWWCQYCANFDLCADCYDSISNGRLISPLCSLKHNLMHLYHTDYTADEVADNMVRIDWEWEDLGNGKFNRRGGDIVPLSKWLEKLRETWKLPKDLGDTRAQK